MRPSSRGLETQGLKCLDFNNSTSSLNLRRLAEVVQYMLLFRMWCMKCMIIPVIIGAAGIGNKSLKQNLETILGKQSIDSL
jgi:hypothetical protein